MKRKPSLVVLLTCVIVALLAVVGVLFWKYQQASKDPQAAAQETSARIIDKVGQIYMLPTDEEPTVAQIQDKSKLGNQEFFKSSENGDFLLIYQKAKVALVYREGSNKLITVGPVNIGEDGGQNQQGQTAGAQTENNSQTESTTEGE